MSDTQACIVITTTASQADAMELSSSIIEQQLAACVQIVGPITSCYRWNGKTESSTEWRIECKTVSETANHLIQFIRQLHSYEEPEIVVVPIVDGSGSYLDWVAEQVHHPQSWSK